MSGLSDMRVEEVKGRKRRVRKLGIVEAMMMATTGRMRVVGESFRFMNGVEEIVKVYLWNNGGVCNLYIRLTSRVHLSPIDKGRDDKSGGGEKHFSHS